MATIQNLCKVVCAATVCACSQKYCVPELHCKIILYDRKMTFQGKVQIDVSYMEMVHSLPQYSSPLIF